jgi:hypothetical protein
MWFGQALNACLQHVVVFQQTMVTLNPSQAIQ